MRSDGKRVALSRRALLVHHGLELAPVEAWDQGTRGVVYYYLGVPLGPVSYSCRVAVAEGTLKGPPR